MVTTLVETGAWMNGSASVKDGLGWWWAARAVRALVVGNDYEFPKLRGSRHTTRRILQTQSASTLMHS